MSQQCRLVGIGAVIRRKFDQPLERMSCPQVASAVGAFGREMTPASPLFQGLMSSAMLPGPRDTQRSAHEGLGLCVALGIVSNLYTDQRDTLHPISVSCRLSRLRRGNESTAGRDY